MPLSKDTIARSESLADFPFETSDWFWWIGHCVEVLLFILFWKKKNENMNSITNWLVHYLNGLL